ncbi:MAG: hypothetical protein ACLP1X_25765 [Polyangiaceae bacterium]|jgi:hypothetical protein
MAKCGLFAMSSVLALGFAALGCARSQPEPSVPPPPASWALVYVTGTEATLERRDDSTLDWSAACSSTCGQYVSVSGTYRLRGADATSAPFALPAPDLGRVVLRFDGNGHVWTQRAPGMPRQPFAPLVLFLQVR